MSWEQLFAEAKDVCIPPIHHEQKLQIAFGDPCFLCVVPVAPPAWISHPGGIFPPNLQQPWVHRIQKEFAGIISMRKGPTPPIHGGYLPGTT